MPPQAFKLAGHSAGAARFARNGLTFPLYRRNRRIRDRETAKGLIVAAAITFLLNARCWGPFSARSFALPDDQRVLTLHSTAPHAVARYD